MQKGQALVLVLVGILLLATVAGGAYYLGRSTVSKPESQSPVITSSPHPATPTVVDETADWKTYTDEKLRFRFKYPDGWKDPYFCCFRIVAEYDLLPAHKDYDPKSGMPAPINTKEEFLEQKGLVEKGLLLPEYETESRLLKPLKVGNKYAVQYYSLSLSGGGYLINTTIFTDKLRIDLFQPLPLEAVFSKPLEGNPSWVYNEQNLTKLDGLARGNFNKEIEEVVKEHNLVLSTFKFLE